MTAAASTPKKSGGGDSRVAKKELNRVEREIGRLDQRETKLHGALAEKAADYAAVADLSAELQAVQAEKAALEDTWLELSESIE